jgi:hypothetical protein
MRIQLVVFGFACMLLVSSCRPSSPLGPRGAAQPSPSDVFEHKPSNFRFPLTVGNFAREAVKQYDQSGLNVSVGYNLGQQAAVTVYVYPVQEKPPRNDLKEHYKFCKEEVLRAHQGGLIVAEGPTDLKPGGQEQGGFQAAFTYTARFAGREQPVRSELYLYRHGRWFIKYRATYAVGDQPKAEPAVKEFIDAWKWPEGGGP